MPIRASCIDQLVDRFDLRRIGDGFCNHDPSTKDPDRDFGFYRDHYLNERWKEALSPSAVRTINDSIDRELMHRFGYEVL